MSFSIRLNDEEKMLADSYAKLHGMALGEAFKTALFEKIEDAINRLEQDDISLEDSFKIYKEGMDLLKQCHEKIDYVEKKVLEINEAGDIVEF